MPPPGTDQRGSPFVRVFAGRIDMGAFEAQVHIKGDMNFDGRADMDDIDALVTAFRDAAAYEARYGVPPGVNGDTDDDGDFDFDDIPGFIQIVAPGAKAAGTAERSAAPSEKLDQARSGTLRSRRVAKADMAHAPRTAAAGRRISAQHADTVWSGDLVWLGRPHRHRG